MPEKNTPTANAQPDAMASSLLGQLVMASYDQYVATTRGLVESLQADNKRLRATLDYIRSAVEAAVSGQYMPTPQYLTGLLYPFDQQIAEYLDSSP